MSAKPDRRLHRWRLLHDAPDVGQGLYASAPQPAPDRSAVRHTVSDPRADKVAVTTVAKAPESEMNMVRCFCYSLYKLIGLRAFVEEGLGPRAKIGLAVGRARVAAEHHESDVRRGMTHSEQHLQARATFQLHVQHDHTGMSGEDTVDGSLRGLGVAHNRHGTSLQQAGDPITDQCGVFGEEDIDAAGKGFSHASTVAAVLS